MKELRASGSIRDEAEIILKLFDLMKTPLSVRQAKTGSIVMWNHPKVTYAVTICSTGKSNVASKIKRVKKRSGYLPLPFLQDKVHCANLLKRLIKTELQNHQMQEQETQAVWFAVGTDLALKTWKRWQKWIRLEPYWSDRTLIYLWESTIQEAPKLKTLEEFHGWFEDAIDRCYRHRDSVGYDNNHAKQSGNSPRNVNLVERLEIEEILHTKASNEDLKKAKLLLENNGVDVNSVPDDPEKTPLHQAAENGRQAIVMALIATGADVNVCSELRGLERPKRTPLYMAARNGHQAVVQSLIDAGARIDLKNGYPILPIHIAALKGHRGVVDILLQRSRELNLVLGPHIMRLVDELISSSSPTREHPEKDNDSHSTGVGTESAPYLVQELTDTDQDLQSIASIETFNDSGFFSGSQISQALIVTAKAQLLEIFMTDDELRVLFKESTRKISREKFIRNFKRLIRTYCLELNGHASLTEKDVVKFLGKQAIWFADEIYRGFNPVDILLRNAMDRLARQMPDKVRQLDKYLEVHMKEAPLESVETQQIKEDDRDRKQHIKGPPLVDEKLQQFKSGRGPSRDDNKSDSSDSSDSSVSGGDISLDDDIEDPEFQNVNHIKEFLVSGVPFQNLKENFRHFVHPSYPMEPETISEVCDQSRGTTTALTTTSPNLSPPRTLPTSYLHTIINHLRNSLRPRIQDGYQRITWDCGCGKSMYADVKELFPGAALCLQENLRLSAAAASEAASNQTNPTAPSPAYSPSANTEQGSPWNPKSPIRSLDANFLNAPAVDITPDTKAQTRHTEPFKRYLLLCINTNKRVHLEQIEVTYTSNDQILFQGIRQAYYTARKTESLGHFATLPVFLGSLFGEISFSRPKSANFVRFELVPMKATAHAAVLDFPTLPPVEEVKVKKRYHYVPCPKDIENPLLQVQFLHEYFKPGRHLGNFWLNRLPKKLKEKLFLNTDGLAIGWGIHIVEEPNWFAYGFVAVAIVALSGVLSLVYSVCAKDVSGGFGMGAYMIAAQAVTLSTLFFKWQQA